MRLIETTERVIPAGRVKLHATASIPEGAAGMVIFAHGAGSSRFSPPDLFVAAELMRDGLATLLVDLLTVAEEDLPPRAGDRFGPTLLAGRLEQVTAWLAGAAGTAGLELGYFGAGDCAAAALLAAAACPERVRAVVSRGGRPDLAGEALSRVLAPTLLITGERDRALRAANEAAMGWMTRSEVTLRVVPGAGHAFEENGALAEVAVMTREFFARHLADWPSAHLETARTRARSRRSLAG